MGITEFEKNYMDFMKKSFEKKTILDSCIEKTKCIELIKAAIKDSIALVKKEINNDHLYGLSFELSNTVDRNSYYSYNLGIYFNTKEYLLKSSFPDDLDFRYGIWSEWMAITSDTESAKLLKNYLYQNKTPEDSDIEKSSDEMSKDEKDAFEWYKNEWEAVDDKKNEERASIRKYMTLAIAELNKEKFFSSMFGAVNVYPYSGECALKKEEILEHYKLMENEITDENFITYVDSWE